jgi:hypothetical protein
MFSVVLGEITHNEFSSEIVISRIPAPKIQDAGCAWKNLLALVTGCR